MGKKLRNIRYEILPFAPHDGLFLDVLERLETAAEVIRITVAPHLPAFRDSVAGEHAVRLWVRKSELTGQIAAADREIDRLLVGINALVRSGRHATAPATREAGNRVYDLIKNYGEIVKAPYDTKASSVLSLLDHFADDYAPDMAALGATAWATLLQEAYDTFRSLFAQRENEQLAKPRYTALQARTRTERAWAPIAEVINANAVVGAAPAAFGAFIDQLNFEIARYNTEFKPARVDLSAPGLSYTEHIPEQAATGKPITPEVVLYARPSALKPFARLFAGRDYLMTFRNNVKPGTAVAIIRGKGKYRGALRVTFNIVES
jgi:hypothetical protein